MPQELRVVLDTNVLVSALVFRQGSIATLRTAWQAQHFIPLVSRATATELIRDLLSLQAVFEVPIVKVEAFFQILKQRI
ncbi:putative toxin-antitoxin system toxin component, PIN family [Nodosilinea sp. PGN35]|uniref:PIN domain-containing protein n=1 Tax=Nodosilinea sp. PGN35 TaxID=3020489 RepID=UPI0023B2BE65|nr:PIN domain-containing protein [Nodosilinea sp. TSF1-S3]MDF0365651.1 PIN domain-containing protein [Nodosilinea sp. TSF1-S3]